MQNTKNDFAQFEHPQSFDTNDSGSRNWNWVTFYALA